MAKETLVEVLPKGCKLKSKEREYEIVDKLGSGSFGITYLAKARVSIGNIETSLKFAIKEHFISASCSRGDDGVSVQTVTGAKSDVANSREDFITEANRLKKLCLKSRSIVSVNETFEANGTAYYVMEYLDGGNPRKCSEEEAVSIVMQIASALDEIHKEHVLHLDLKPDNIVLKTNDRNETYPVLIDFGISKHFDSKGRPTSSLNAKGASPGYASQEQYAGVNEFTPKYDIYALGAVLFYLCTGKNPPNAFDISPNQQELRRELTGKVPANIEKAILNAMKPSAIERTPDIQRFRDDLMGIDFIPVLTPSTSTVEFNSNKGQYTLSVDSNIGWTVYADEDWCKASKKNSDIVISVFRNKDSGNRDCKVIINGDSYQIFQIINIKQEGVGTGVFPKKPTWWNRNSEKVYTSFKLMATLLVMGGIYIGGYQLIKEDYDSYSRESRQLDSAIRRRDEGTLKMFVELDSTRAFLPYAELLYLKGRFWAVETYAEKAKALGGEDSIQAEKLIVDANAKTEKFFQTLKKRPMPAAESSTVSQQETPLDIQEPAPEATKESNDEKFARASNDFDLMLSLAKNNYAKAYYPLAEMYFKRNNLENAMNWAKKAVNANVNRKQAQDLLSKIVPPSPSNDELFAKATTLEDFKALANKGYKKAYAPLAEQYLEKHQYDSAHQWAIKAASAKSGIDIARKVVEELNSYGYYDNGEHGGKPNF